MDPFRAIATERRRLADELDELTPEQWRLPSLCGQWDVHTVVAHLTAPWEVPLPTFAAAMLRARGNFDRASARAATDLARRLDPAACVASLRANADHRFTPPGHGPLAPLTDVVVHGVDALHPAGRRVAPDPEALGEVVAWLSRGRAFGFLPAGRVAGLSFVATDLDRTFGDGAPVEGPAVALAAAMLGRRALLDECTGEGVAVLASRI